VFKASEHKFLLKWTGGTNAEHINAHDIPKPQIKFKPFAEIISLKWKPDVLVSEFISTYVLLTLRIYLDSFVFYHHAIFFLQDVIGLVQEMRYCQLNEGTGKKLQINFTMKDLRCVCYTFA
jgi:hypothetical protein